MLKSLMLVLEDFESDRSMVELGVKWAAESNALLTGMCAIDEPPVEAVPLGGAHAKPELDAARLHALRVAAESELSAVSLQCVSAGVAFKPLECIGDSIKDIGVEAQRFDLILMSRRLEKADEPRRWAVSDKFSAVLRTAPRPVVAVPEQQRVGGNDVVIAYDGSLQAARTLFAFEATGLAARGKVHVVSFQEEAVEAARRGDRAVEYLRLRGIDAQLHAQASHRPAQQILEFVRQADAGLVVLGAYGKSRFIDFLLGSVTKTILAECPVPLFMFH